MIQIHTAPPASSIESPVAHLAACHRRIEERLDTLERVAQHLRTRSGEALSAIQGVFWFFDSSGVNHTADEEESFFPRFTARLTPDEQQLLNTLKTEHTRAEAIYDDLKAHVAKMANPPSVADQHRYAELASALCSLYRQHIRNEDAHFPAIAQRTLSAEDLDAITLEMKQRRGL